MDRSFPRPDEGVNGAAIERNRPSFIPSRRPAPRQAGGFGSSLASSSHHIQPASRPDPRGERRSRASVSGIRIGRGSRRDRRRAGGSPAPPARHCGQAAAGARYTAGHIAGRGRRSASGSAARRAGSRLRPSPPNVSATWVASWTTSGLDLAAAQPAMDQFEEPLRQVAFQLAAAVGLQRRTRRRGTARARGPGRSPAARHRAGRVSLGLAAAAGIEPFPQARRRPDRRGTGRRTRSSSSLGLGPAAGPDGLVDLGQRPRPIRIGRICRRDRRPAGVPAPRPVVRGRRSPGRPVRAIARPIARPARTESAIAAAADPAGDRRCPAGEREGQDESPRPRGRPEPEPEGRRPVVDQRDRAGDRPEDAQHQQPPARKGRSRQGLSDGDPAAFQSPRRRDRAGRRRRTRRRRLEFGRCVSSVCSSIRLSDSRRMHRSEPPVGNYSGSDAAGPAASITIPSGEQRDEDHAGRRSGRPAWSSHGIPPVRSRSAAIASAATTLIVTRPIAAGLAHPPNCLAIRLVATRSSSIIDSSRW